MFLVGDFFGENSNLIMCYLHKFFLLRKSLHLIVVQSTDGRIRLKDKRSMKINRVNYAIKDKNVFKNVSEHF